MNTIPATVLEIHTVDKLTQVTFKTAMGELKMIGLELPSNIKQNQKLTLNCKATNIAIAKKADTMLSFSNQLPVTIEELQMGELLCSLLLLYGETSLESIITADSAKRMHLQVGEDVTALIKSSDLSIAEVCS